MAKVQQCHQTCSRNFKLSVPPKGIKAKDIRTNSGDLETAFDAAKKSWRHVEFIPNNALWQRADGVRFTNRVFPIPQQSYRVNKIFEGVQITCLAQNNPIKFHQYYAVTSWLLYKEQSFEEKLTEPT